MTTFAPYNFIPFFDECVFERYRERTELPKHNTYLKGTYTGRIDYTLENITELFIGSGKNNDKNEYEEFFKDALGKNVIPGSTIRGLLRSNTEILSFSYPEFIDEEIYMYRKFADNCKNVRKEYENEMKSSKENDLKIPDGVKAGYVYWKDKDTLVIQPVKGFGKSGTTFFKIHEHDLRELDILSEEEYMYKEQIEKFTYKDKENYKEQIENCIDEKRKKTLKQKLKESIDEQYKYYSKKIGKSFNEKYKPYRHEDIKFDIENDSIINLKGSSYSGTLLNSAYIRGKTHHFLVSTEEDDNPNNIIEVKKELAYAYVHDYKRNCIQNKKLKEQDYFYNLPMDEERPIIGKDEKKLFFYKYSGNGLIGFGPTPYFRIFYKNKVRNGISVIKKGENKVYYDYVNSVFGYIYSNNDKKEHYKSRVNVSNCVLVNENIEYKKREALLLQPKGTAFQMYLNQDGREVKEEGENGLSTYNDEKMKLRGYKFYWRRKEIISNGKNKIMQKFLAIPKNNEFVGTIYFENLNEDELGLLLFCMKTSYNDENKECHLIGKAKAYGFGSVRFKKIKLSYYVNNEESGAGNLKINFLQAKGNKMIQKKLYGYDKNDNDIANKFIDSYKIKIEKYLKNNYDSNETIKTYKYSKEKVNENDYVYMPLKENNVGYNTREPLPNAKDVKLKKDVKFKKNELIENEKYLVKVIGYRNNEKGNKATYVIVETENGIRGTIHISEIADYYINNIEDEMIKGNEYEVIYIGKNKFSRKMIKK